jgi:catechol 2,3-dioxygenase-like lactoylglutathione lyase family enzyme
MIVGAHLLALSSDADATRAFLRDKLSLDGVDAGGGWLIFALPPAEIAAHPAEEGGHTSLHFMCDDLEATMSELRAKGVEFAGDVVDEGWGRVAHMLVPGMGEVALYEPRHATALPR